MGAENNAMLPYLEDDKRFADLFNQLYSFSRSLSLRQARIINSSRSDVWKPEQSTSSLAHTKTVSEYRQSEQICGKRYCKR